MTAIQKSSSIFIDETERKPNLYASRMLVSIVSVIAVVWLLNETGVFQVDRTLVRICVLFSLLMYILMRLIVRDPVRLVRPWVKYSFMAIILALVLTVTVLLNIHAILAFVLPLLLATQYRSYRMSRIALIGSCCACAVAPILSYLLNTWSLSFMTGYIQTFCRVTVTAFPGNGLSDLEAIYQIALYWALPQVLTVAAFGLILFTVTKSGIDSVSNQMQVSDLSNDLSRQLESILSMQEKVLFAMSDMIENRDSDTGGHVRRTSEVVRLLVNAMKNEPSSGIDEVFCASVVKCAPMHDLGKLAIPDTILKKTDRLTDDEFEIIKLHPVRSADIIHHALTGIEDERLLTIAANIARHHHERYDGSGYPDGLKGTEIPLEARIMAIADVYDALVSKRCYKDAMSCEVAFDTVMASMGTQFDPGLGRFLLSCRKDIEDYYLNVPSES